MDKGNYLDSWKEISAYLGRNVRTCRNWEQDLGLPIHRLEGSPKSHVFAYTGEIDAWREKKGRLPGNRETNGTDSPEEPNLPPAPAPVPIRRSLRAWLRFGCMTGLLLAVVAATQVIRRLSPTLKPAVSQFIIKVEPGHWLDGARSPWDMERPTRTAIVISSDGRFIVYSAIEANSAPEARPRLFLRKMDQSEAKPIAGTEGGINPFLSPDNRWVGFWAAGKILKIPVTGGVATALCDASQIFGASWGRDGRILFSEEEFAGLSQVPSSGGMPEILTRPDPKREEYGHRLPSWLPDGKSALFTVVKHGLDRKSSIALLRLETRQWSVLLQNAADARYIPTGHLVFLQQGTLMSVGFDPASQVVMGQPIALVDNVIQALCLGSRGHTCAGQFGISDNGSLLYAAGGIVPDEENSLEWVDQNGTAQPVTGLKTSYFAPRLSPDGSRIVYQTLGRECQVIVYDMETGIHSPMTLDGFAGFPIWSPDGKRLLFSWMRALVPNLFWQPSDGSSPMERLSTGEYSQDAGSWLPNRNVVAFVEFRTDSFFDIALLDLGTGQVTPFLNSTCYEAYPEFSPDGRWIAYASDESGRNEVYVRAFPGPGIKRLISSDGGSQPIWAKDGKMLFYRCGDQVWAVEIREGGGFSPGKPRLLFEKPGYGWGAPIRTYDLSPDGKRFLMVKEEQRKPAPVTELMFVENWFEELKRLASAGKK